VDSVNQAPEVTPAADRRVVSVSLPATFITVGACLIAAVSAGLASSLWPAGLAVLSGRDDPLDWPAAVYWLVALPHAAMAAAFVFRPVTQRAHRLFGEPGLALRPVR
jgi:hypothetical protein